MYLEDDFQDKNESSLNFYSTVKEDLALKFDCVAGRKVQHKFPLHIHFSLCIGLITNGQRNMIFGGKSEIINRNEIFVINKNQPHAINQTEPHDYIAITINGDFENIVFENIIQSEICTDKFLQLFCALRDNTDEINKKWNELYQYLINTHKKSESLPLNKNFICKALTYIHQNYHNPLSVDDIAAHVYMSTYHFCRLFKQLTGLSPHNYLRQYRLSQSCKHLQNNMPVFDTAIETGFYDSSHFIKTFHSYMAVSPQKYRKSVIKQ